MKKLTNTLKYVLLLAISAALMVYALRGQDLSSIKHYIVTANYSWLILTMALSVLGYFSRAYRWQMQLTAAGRTASFWQVYHAMMVGNLANVVLPRMGEVIRCSVLWRSNKIPVDVALGTVVAERVIDVLVLAGLLGTVLAIDFNRFWGLVVEKLLGGNYDAMARNRTPLLIAAAIALVLGLAALYALFRNLERLRQNALFAKVVKFVKGLLAGVFSVLKLEKKGVFLLHTAFTWLVYYLMNYLAFRCFPETAGLDWRAGLAVLTFGTFGMAAPVSGGIGTFHILVQSVLLAYGISLEAGIAFALVVHGAQTLLIALMGAISFVATVAKKAPTAELVAEIAQPIPPQA
ncbi:lysylphosphatidylglycerol synthase transmembrane domain-containing protein [Hymenobacter sp. ASUV-10]|uniref:Lysylphosphatidylglycerol synthase transmembrane domain-containing protein n=1 Tax=Hymenobacter aranciens TaxID=3063996 RepID=A0ABT9B616_9BACT|nr:lysylphosphatidylglycerol synthase transmembrane domain-containing protein [Hymenobacter sp. ASUV-10]MDO7873235.1 lysylphosphatidylglycerol synthase transmembrane domain-containing protein [Hymenobacter sp. ASUV-10]